MKKIMFAFCFMVGGVVAVSAQETQDTTSNQYRTETESQYPQDAMSQDQDRERIQATELPDGVKRTLEGEEYRGWLISGAFKSNETGDQSMMESDTTSTGVNEPSINATETEGEETFIVELKNGAETRTIKFDSNGEMLEDMSENTPNNEFNQNDQMDQTVPADPSIPTEPSIPADPSTPADPTLETDPNATEQPGQSQTPGELETSDPATQPQPDQSTQTETQPDQSTVTEPK